MEAIKYFSATTSLSTNAEKSNIFLADVFEDVKNRMLEITGFKIGNLLIRYFGLPLIHNKWSKMDCH